MRSHFSSDQPAPRKGYIPAENAELYYREIGQGQPIIILHGRPDFDHGYLLPNMDRLADAFRLIYYDQRGRGRSAGHVKPELAIVTFSHEAAVVAVVNPAIPDLLQRSRRTGCVRGKSQIIKSWALIE